MEKFAIDLDKVLDEFEFNEDRAEQVASVVTRHIGSSTISSQVLIPKTHNRPSTSSTVLNEDMKHKDERSNTEDLPVRLEKENINDNLASFRKAELKLDNIDSVNHFYTHGHHNDRKIQLKQCVESQSIDLEPVSIIRNDISQKLLQKKLNDSTNAKIPNSYDKLNQPKPSVSNVFNSLNEYINAPSVSLVPEMDFSDPESDEESAKIDSKTECTVIKNITTDTGSISVIKNDIGTANIIPKISNAGTLPPKYQNILIPIKLDTGIGKPSNVAIAEHKTPDNIAVSLETNKTTNIERSSRVHPEKFDRPEVRSFIDEPGYVYENFIIGTDISKSQEIRSTVNKIKKSNTKEFKPEFEGAEIEPEVKHIYENVDFKMKSIQPSDKENVYECIYLNSRENLSELSPDLGAVDKKLDNICSMKKVQESEIKGSNTTRLVFQNVQLNTQPQEYKPVDFVSIDNLSEEELNRYLAELEAEDRVNETGSSETRNREFHNNLNDEDADEAPIFESVTIGELPRVPEEDLQQKVKKLPVIDYSRDRSIEVSSDFLAKSGTENFHEITKPITRLNKKKERVEESRTINEITETSSGNSILTREKSLKSDVGKMTSKEVMEQSGENENVTFHTESTVKENIEDTKDTAEDFQVIPGNISHEIHYQDSNGFESAEVELSTEFDPISEETNHESNPIENFIEVQKKESEIEPSTEKNHVDHDEKCEGNLEKPVRPQTLNIVSSHNMNELLCESLEILDEEGSENPRIRDEINVPSPDVSDNSSLDSGMVLGKQPPFWIPDSDASNCMLCDVKFTVIKRRHHCRACGKVLCSKCCNMKYRLEYQGNIDSRVCLPCYQLLIKAENDQETGEWPGYLNNPTNSSGISSPQGRQPNPNNPMEYCSTIPPLQQLVGGLPPPPTVMVPVGVLKREGSIKQRSEGPKSVMFSDGIRPGCDLTELETSWNIKPLSKKMGSKRFSATDFSSISSTNKKSNLPVLNPLTNSYLPQDENLLPPTVSVHKGQITYQDVLDQSNLSISLRNECQAPVMFAINRNLYAYIKIIDLNCCVNRICWNITTKGLACVGQDELVFLIESLPDETQIPRDVLLHINQIYLAASKGNTICEYDMSLHQSGNLLGSREHAGFLFIRHTLQCLQNIVLPPAPFLFGLLVHRWETPWAKVFPLRLVLRLGAEYRYYPCPLVSVRFRNALYFEIGHTIMKVLADFRNFAYTLPSVRGLTIHMQDRTTLVRIPRNRYDQVIKGLNNSNDHVLAFAANFSLQADSHLVCIQTNSEEESNYQTQAINIQIKPRKVTGASFIVINGALKSSMGLSAKSSIVEDGLMVQVMPEQMEALKTALKNMQDFTIGCGRQDAPKPDEVVNIQWVENDVLFNLGVKSPIDGRIMDGIPSIRVHNGVDYVGTSRLIRWTEVFIIKSDDHSHGVHDPLDINKLSENIARATCTALVKLLDLLATAGLTKLAVRTTIHPDNVGYEAGSEGTRLPPIYMNSLDNELIQVLQKAVQSSQDTSIVLELIFYVLNSENYCV